MMIMNQNQNKKFIAIFAGVAVIFFLTGTAVFFTYKFFIKTNTEPEVIIKDQKITPDPKNTTYTIEGEQFILKSGFSEKGTAYFGNEVKGDFNGDKLEDIAFLLTQNKGGTGTFFYMAVLFDDNNGGAVSNVNFIGDRIAPLNTEFRDGLIIVHFAERKPGEPFSEKPSVVVSKYFGIKGNQINEIFLKINNSEARIIAEKNCLLEGETIGQGFYNENTRTWRFDANLNNKKEECNPACVVFEDTGKAEINWRCQGADIPNLIE